MADKKNYSWVDRTGKNDAQPRVVFADHMVVFASTGLRKCLSPERDHNDGINHPSQPIFIAGPEDLRPENHEKLKSILAEKIAEARKLSFSEREREFIKEQFMRKVIEEAVAKEPVMMIRHFSKQLAALRNKYGSGEMMQSIAEHHSQKVFNYHTATNMILHGINNDLEAYKHTKILFRQNGKQAHFEEIEADVATRLFERRLNHLDLTRKEKSALVDHAVRVRTSGDGKQRLTIDSTSLTKLYLGYIDKNYADLDKIINQARAQMVAMSQNYDPSDPFAISPEEHAMAERIHASAHKDVLAKPVALAGYNNPNLLVVVENEPNGKYTGRSYPGQDMIQVVLSPKISNDFDRTVREELVHQGIDRIYKNYTLPYLNNNDMRKSLLENALTFDMKSPDDFAMLGLSSTTNYDIRDTVSMQQEVPVKVMLMMDDPARKLTWPDGKIPYAAIQTFVNEVIIKDALAYNRNQALAHIDEEYIREMPSAVETLSVSRAQPLPRQGL